MRHLLLTAPLLLWSCSPAAPQVDMSQALRVFETLSADDMEGRATGTAGGLRAQNYLRSEIGKLDVFDKIDDFSFTYIPNKDAPEETLSGVNLNALIDIEDNDNGPLLVITAHYDHLGLYDDEIYNGADDNASGSAALFAIAQSFAKSAPEHDVLFIWLDAEERGLGGIREYLKSTQNFQGRSVFNMNLDMVSQSESELYMAGAYHLPALKPLMEKAAKGTGVMLRFGHDRPEDKGNDWTLQSDHGAFHSVGIPFAYFGVEDHPHYHRPSDTFETIPLEFYEGSVKTLVAAAHILDENLGHLAKAASK